MGTPLNGDLSPGYCIRQSLFNNRIMITLRKKIVFTATTPFAVNAFLIPHLRALSDGFEVILCVNKNEYEFSQDFPKEVAIKQIDFKRRISFLWDIKALFQLIFFFIKVSPVSVHSITPKAGLLTMIAGFIASIPYRNHTFTGQIWVNQKGLRRNIYKFFDKVIVFLSTNVFSDSRSQNDFLVKEGIVSDYKIKTLGPGSITGVNLQKFCESECQKQKLRNTLGVSDIAIVFLFVGRVTKDKGILDLLEAYASVSSSCNFVELWVVGPDEEKLLVKNQKLSNNYKGTIRWMGKTMHPEKFMQAADILVLPSFREGFGSVIIEAAACGIPTIAYHIDGVVDAVVNNKTGLLVPLSNVSLLTSAMISLAKNDIYRKDLAKNAKKRVSKEFSENIVVRAWLSFYQTIRD